MLVDDLIKELEKVKGKGMYVGIVLGSGEKYFMDEARSARVEEWQVDSTKFNQFVISPNSY